MKLWLAGTAFGPTRAFPEIHKAGTRQILSFGLRSSDMLMVEIKESLTYVLSIPLEVEPTALRVGVANTTTASYEIDGICCSQDGLDAKANSNWIHLTPAVAGSDHSSRRFIVPGNRVPDALSIFWSQWAQFQGSDGPGRPQMTFRVLVRPQTLPLVRPYAGDLGVATTGSSPKVVREAYLVGDYVTNPLEPIGSLLSTPDSPLFVVQYRTAVPGFQIAIGGDSHLAGWDTFVQLAATEVSRPTKPISVWNGARGGAPSRIFGPILEEVIDDADPSIVVIQGWTANDGMRPAADLAYLDRVQAWATRILQNRGMPIILKRAAQEPVRDAGAKLVARGEQADRHACARSRCVRSKSICRGSRTSRKLETGVHQGWRTSQSARQSRPRGSLRGAPAITGLRRIRVQ